MKTDSALTVSQLNMYVKMLFEADVRLKNICVTGEVSNFVNHYKTGHCYFSVKDENSAVKAVMFARNASRLTFVPENGMKVYISGRLSVFERDGTYQIYVDSMEPVGSGALMIAFEQLKEKLEREGLFDSDRKRILPHFPERIAVITSPVGAAVQDITNVLSRRYPLVNMVFCPVAVQGVNCADENIKALNSVNKHNDIDLIILGRGGGSIEDLWGYNDEQLVRTVAASRIPVITGIGHETDFTLCDFVSDMRAPTPSAAAELAVPDMADLFKNIDDYSYRAEMALTSYLDLLKNKESSLNARLKLLDPNLVIDKRMTECKMLTSEVNMAVKNLMLLHENKLNVITEKLKFSNPLTLLEKGYITALKDGNRISSIEGLNAGDNLELRFRDGTATCVVNKLTEN